MFKRGSDNIPETDPQGDYVVQVDGDVVRYLGFGAYRWLFVSVEDGEVLNDGTATETVTIKIVDGLEVARGTDPANATLLDYGGEIMLSVDGSETTKTLTSGFVEFDITTEKPAGSTIEIVAESLADHPAESDSATIEVVS